MVENIYKEPVAGIPPLLTVEQYFIPAFLIRGIAYTLQALVASFNSLYHLFANISSIVRKIICHICCN